MITHIVLLKPKSETTPAEMQPVLAQVQALQQQIPGIVDVQVGENLSMSHQGYTYGFIMHFIDMERLKAYAPHPAHRVVSDEIRRVQCHDIGFIDTEKSEQIKEVFFQPSFYSLWDFSKT